MAPHRRQHAKARDENSCPRPRHGRAAPMRPRPGVQPLVPRPDEDGRTKGRAEELIHLACTKRARDGSRTGSGRANSHLCSVLAIRTERRTPRSPSRLCQAYARLHGARAVRPYEAANREQRVSGLVITRGTNNKPAATEALEDHLQAVKGMRGELFVGYPIIGTVSEALLPDTSASSSRRRGVWGSGREFKSTLHLQQTAVLSDVFALVPDLAATRVDVPWPRSTASCWLGGHPVRSLAARRDVGGERHPCRDGRHACRSRRQGCRRPCLVTGPPGVAPAKVQAAGRARTGLDGTQQEQDADLLRHRADTALTVPLSGATIGRQASVREGAMAHPKGQVHEQAWERRGQRPAS